jgi:hypothetical protein
MSGVAHSNAKSPRLSPNRLQGAVVCANQLPKHNLPCRRKSEGGDVSKATSSFWWPHRPACGPKIGRIWVRLVTCMSRRSCADIRSDCSQKGSSRRLMRRSESAKRGGLLVSPHVMRINICRSGVTGQDTQVLKLRGGTRGDRGDGRLTRQAWILILRAKGGTLEGRAEGDGDGRGADGEKPSGCWGVSKGGGEAETETRIEPKVATDKIYRKGRECLH